MTLTVADGLLSTGFHEAGHVLAAIVLKLPLDFATVFHHEHGVAGCTQLSKPAWDNVERNYHALAVQTAAGPVAEAMFSCSTREARHDLKLGASHDNYVLHELALLATCTSAVRDFGADARYVIRCKRDARALLEGRRAAVSAVADALIAAVNHRVPGSRLLQLANGAA